MSQDVNVGTSSAPATVERAVWTQDHLREHITRAVLLYLRRRRDVLRDLSESQVQCLIETITRKAERVVRNRLGKCVDDAKPATWIGAIAIREAMWAFMGHRDAREAHAAWTLKPVRLVATLCPERRT